MGIINDYKQIITTYGNADHMSTCDKLEADITTCKRFTFLGAVTIGIGALIVVGVGGIGIAGLVHSYGLQLAQSLQGLTPFIGTIGQNGLWAMTILGGLIGIAGVMGGISLIHTHRISVLKNEFITNSMFLNYIHIANLMSANMSNDLETDIHIMGTSLDAIIKDDTQRGVIFSRNVVGEDNSYVMIVKTHSGETKYSGRLKSTHLKDILNIFKNNFSYNCPEAEKISKKRATKFNKDRVQNTVARLDTV